MKQTCALYTHSQRKTLYVCWGNSRETPKLKAVRLLLYQSTDNYICTPRCNLWIHIYDRSMKCYQLLPNNERGLLVFTQHLKFFYYLYRNYFIGGGKKILIYDLDSDTRIGSNFSPSVCNPSVMLSSPVSMVPGHIWLALPKRKNFFTQGAFFSFPFVLYFSIWLIFLK